MKPLNNFIHIELEERKYKGDLIDPRSKSDKQAERAKVLSVGPSVQDIKKGDTVIYKSYNLFVIELDGKEYCFVTEDEVIAKE